MISPLLANIYLHYAFDLWVKAWRKKVARGEMIVIRYADDAVLGFEHRADAVRFLYKLQERVDNPLQVNNLPHHRRASPIWLSAAFARARQT